jgi:hypothetical protein
VVAEDRVLELQRHFGPVPQMHPEHCTACRCGYRSSVRQSSIGDTPKSELLLDRGALGYMVDQHILRRTRHVHMHMNTYWHRNQYERRATHRSCRKGFCVFRQLERRCADQESSHDPIQCAFYSAPNNAAAEPMPPFHTTIEAPKSRGNDRRSTPRAVPQKAPRWCTPSTRSSRR